MRTLLAVSCVTLAACSTGYNHGVMERELAQAKLSYTSRQLSIAEIDALRPQVPLPARIAVAPPRDGWTPAEVAVLESWEEPLRKSRVAKDLVILPVGLVRECSYSSEHCRVEALRAAAARAHADAILLIHFASDRDHYVNPASLLYLTVVGLWIVPGSHRDALTIADGVLLDNRNEYLYAFARGEGETRTMRPAIYSNHEDPVAESRVEALRDLGTHLLEEASQLRVAQ